MDLFSLVYHVFALLILAIGTFVLFDDIKSKTNWAFFLYAIGAFGWMLSLFWGYYFVGINNYSVGLILFRYAYASSIFGVSFMTAFFYAFPRVTFKIKKLFHYLFFIITGSIFALSIFTPFIHESLILRDGIYLGDNFGFLYPLYSAHILLNLVLSIFFSFHTFYKVQGIERQKIFYAIGGYLAFVVLAVFTNVILPVWNIFILQKQVPILSLFFIIPAFMAIYRYRFFHLSFVSLNFLRGIILYTGFIVGAILVESGLDNVKSFPPIICYVLGIFFALFFYEWLKKSIPTFVTRTHKEFLVALEEFRSKVYYADSYEKMKKIIDEIFILRLHFVIAELFVVRKSDSDIKIPVYKPNRFTKLLEKRRKDVLIREEIKFMKLNDFTRKIFIKEMTRLKADICIPLFSENNLIGLFILKSKYDNLNASKEKIKELSKMHIPLEIALMNLLLKLNLEEENNLMKAIIDDKTKQLKKKIDEINEILMQQADFIAVTAHEFRTPLSIASFQMEDLMSSKKADSLSEELHVLDTSLANLKTLTEKLFAVQQYDLNKVELKLEKVEIASYLKRLCEDFTSVLRNKKLTCTSAIKLKKNCYLKIDQAQFRQVLHNLFNNAAKFTPPDGKIVVSAAAKKDRVVIKVSDNGEGIPDDLKEAIFEKFRTKKAGAGIGLGLYLCKKIIELHKGKIWVEDNEMNGASFCLSLKFFR